MPDPSWKIICAGLVAALLLNIGISFKVAAEDADSTWGIVVGSTIISLGVWVIIFVAAALARGEKKRWTSKRRG